MIKGKSCHEQITEEILINFIFAKKLTNFNKFYSCNESAEQPWSQLHVQSSKHDKVCTVQVTETV